MAAITAQNLTSGGGGTGNTATTASISPGANRLVIVTVQSYLNGGSPATPTVSGASMTWVQIATRQSSSASEWRITLFRGLSASPGSGALTIDFGGTNNQTQWSVDEFDNVSLGGTNGSAAVIQAASNDSSGTSTGITVTLGTFSGVNNATFGALVQAGVNATVAVGSGFTLLINTQNNGRVVTEWKGSNDTGVDWTWSSATEKSIAMAIEIKAESAGGFFAFM